MVLCIVVGCSTKSGKHKDINCFRVPAVISNQGEETEELSRERRNRWISAISRGDVKTKDILQHERVCDRHFVSGRPAAIWDKFNTDWVPTLNLGKTSYREKDHEAATARAERSRTRRKRAIEEQEYKLHVAKQLDILNEAGITVADMEFENSEPGTSILDSSITNEQNMEDIEEEEVVGTPVDIGTQTEMFDVPSPVDVEFQDAETQTDEFEYQFYSKSYQAPDRDYFNTDEKVRFYTGLPSFDVLVTTFEHVAPHVTRRTLSLDKFQEFMIVLMKLRLNVPFQDLAFRFNISLSTVSRIFAS